jgi:hypothetical protein
VEAGTRRRSRCPIHTTEHAGPDHPLYGYRPAIEALVEHVKGSIGE